MPVIANKTIADGQTTPVNHTFYVSNRGEVIEWTDRTGTVPANWAKLSFAAKWNKDQTLLRVRWKLDTPVVETPSGGLAKRVAILRTVAEHFIPERALDSLRADHVAFVRNLVASSDFAVPVRYNEIYA